MIAINKNKIPIYRNAYVRLQANINKQIAAIRYKIDDTIFLFINGSPFEMNYITQKEKLPLGAFETAIREKGIGYELCLAVF